MLARHLLKEEFRLLYALLLFASPMIFATKGLMEHLSPFIGRAFAPIFADLITFFAQILPTLEGPVYKKVLETAKALFTTHKKSFALSIIATTFGSAAAEWVREYNQALAGISYALIPFIVAMATTWDTIQKVQKENGGMSYFEGLELIFKNNPIHLGVDISASLVFASGSIAFGFLGLLDNPYAVAIIEGLMEHPLGAGIAAFIMKLQERRALSPKNTTEKQRIRAFFSKNSP